MSTEVLQFAPTFVSVNSRHAQKLHAKLILEDEISHVRISIRNSDENVRHILTRYINIALNRCKVYCRTGTLFERASRNYNANIALHWCDERGVDLPETRVEVRRSRQRETRTMKIVNNEYTYVDVRISGIRVSDVERRGCTAEEKNIVREIEAGDDTLECLFIIGENRSVPKLKDWVQACGELEEGKIIPSVKPKELSGLIDWEMVLKSEKPSSGMVSRGQKTPSAQLPPQQAEPFGEADSDQEEEEPCRFFNLPEQPRNFIYRLVLVEPKDEDGDTMFCDLSALRASASIPLPEEPALLRTCKQIREEATSIYEQQNVFWIKFDGLDIRTIQAWWRSHNEPKKMRMTLFPMGAVDWPNLLHWLEACATDNFPRIGSHTPGAVTLRDGMDLVEPFFDMVERLRDEGLSWDRIKPNLEDMRKALALAGVQWAIQQ